MGSVTRWLLQIGHSLGMSHDGNGNTCPGNSGFIMSLSTKKQRVGWSTCSVKSFHDFLAQGKGNCLKTEGGPTVNAMANG